METRFAAGLQPVSYTHLDVYKRQVLPSAIFLLVILAGLAAFLVHISTTQSITSAQDIQGARAYHAARAGVDWGLYQVCLLYTSRCV